MTPPPRTLTSESPRMVAPGVIEVTPLTDEWWHVAIGRNRGPKRFNITRGEAALLVDVLTRDVLTQDGPE